MWHSKWKCQRSCKNNFKKSLKHFLSFLIYWTLKYIQWALFSSQLQKWKIRVEENDLLPWNKLLMNEYFFFCFWIIYIYIYTRIYIFSLNLSLKCFEKIGLDWNCVSCFIGWLPSPYKICSSFLALDILAPSFSHWILLCCRQEFIINHNQKSYFAFL